MLLILFSCNLYFILTVLNMLPNMKRMIYIEKNTSNMINDDKYTDSMFNSKNF